jgi:hypothetical protein
MGMYYVGNYTYTFCERILTYSQEGCWIVEIESAMCFSLQTFRVAMNELLLRLTEEVIRYLDTYLYTEIILKQLLVNTTYQIIHIIMFVLVVGLHKPQILLS